MKNEVLNIIMNQPDEEEGLPEILERFGLKSDVSVMIMYLKLESNLMGIVGLAADGQNQYTDEHSRLLKLLHEPFAIAMSNALRHQEIIRFRDEHRSHLRFFQNMDRINRAMQGTNDLEQIMNDVLDAMLEIFDSDRAYLLYPCDPDAPSFEIAMERTRPEYPARRSAIYTAQDNAKHFQLYLASSGAVTLGPGCDYPLELLRFGEKSKIMIALYPKAGKPWVLGMHQCSYPRVWTRDEKDLLEEIARRMSDVLTTLLAYRDLREGEERYRITLQSAMDGFFRADMQGRILEVNETYCRMSGYSEQELLTMNIADIEAVHSSEMIAANIRRFAEVDSGRFESVHRRKDGSLFDVEISAQHQPIAGGQAVIFIRDITGRKRIEKALRQSEAYLAEAQRLSHTGSWAFDLSSDKYVYVSEECFRIFELDAQEGLPTREAVFRQIHPEYWDSVQESFEKSLREKVDTLTEFRIALPSGTVKHIQAIRHPVLNSAGDVVQFVGSVIDITERRRAEDRLRHTIEALRRSETYLAEAQRLTHTGSWARSPRGEHYDYWSEETFRIWGFDPQQPRPTYSSLADRLHPEDRDRVLETIETAQRGKKDYDLQLRIVLPDGPVKHIQIIGHPLPDENGKVAEYVGTTVDITDRKRAEAEINSLKNYLSNIIDSMPSILVGMDNTRTVTQWNRQAEAFTGIPAGEAIGKPIVDLLPDFAPWIMTMGTDMDEHRPLSMEKLLIEKEGKRRFYDLMLYPLLIHDVGGAVLRIEDVTERARIQELMVQTEKMMSIGGLAAGMAHEINNPLGIITQAAQNIERRISLELHANRKVSEELGLNLEGIRAYFDKRQISDAIASIRTASSRAAKIVANMLQFSRRADTTMEPASLAQIVDQALELAASDYDLKKKYDFRSIDIIKDYQDMPQVPIVSMEIEQVILNLLKNAAQAMIANPPDRRPSITLRLRCEGRYAVLEVEDNGPGITEDIRRKVFEPFFTTKEPGVGTGLGLSVSYMIVTQNHKGLMEVQSTPGRGTLFKVRLPIGEGKHEPVG
ncbi:MAG TPA: PAS domain S-box protein [Nitrospirota bacterium]|nr:PAS domain S-box protein [Nitrospirota bacterium]